MENLYYPFVNEPLPYAFDALEPWIDAKTMELNHDRHLQAYIDQLNQILQENPALQRLSLPQLLMQVGKLPGWLQRPVRNQAGGVFNHRFFFESLRPESSAEAEEAPMPEGLMERIRLDFGSFETFQKKFTEAALSVFGSGYAWLVLVRRRLRIMTTPNQDCPLETGAAALLNLDVWEHAYYLKHYNERAAYVEDWFRVVDWSLVEKRLKQGGLIR